MIVSVNTGTLLFTCLIFICGYALIAESNQPDFSQKTRLSNQDIAEKKQGHYVTGIAGPASSPDLGFMVGGVVNVFDNGSKDDPRFAYTPYLHQVMFSAAFSSKGLKTGTVVWDAPYLLNTAYRVRITSGLSHNPVAQYFGVGEQSLDPLKSPYSGKTYKHFANYQNDLRSIYSAPSKQENDNPYSDLPSSYAYYNYFQDTSWGFEPMVMRDFLGGRMRGMLGWYAKRKWINDYSGQEISIDSQRVLSAMTKVRQDYQNGQIVGYNGGMESGFKMGLFYDTRDLEPNPRHGVFHELIISQYFAVLGSDYEYNDVSASMRFFHSPFSDALPLVFAMRLFGSYKMGSRIPFYAQPRIQLSDVEINGLGGVYSLRGFREPRFAASNLLGSNIEFRFTVYKWQAWKQQYALLIVPFFDAGTVYDHRLPHSIDSLRVSYGLGIRLSWNQATVISGDFGFCQEGFGFYLNVRQIF